MFNKLKKNSIKLIRKSINACGFDLVRLNNSPMRTFIGIRSLSVNTIIDIGANTGQFARFVSSIFPEAQLICFEPLPEQFKQLEAWADKIDNKRPLVFNIAIGDKKGEGKIYLHTDHSPSSSILPATKFLGEAYPNTRAKKQIPIQINTLDNIMSELADKTQPDIFIKIDVQGYEDRVIRGGEKILDKASALMIEVSLDLFYHDQTNFSELLQLLAKKKFHYAGNLEQSYTSEGYVSYFDAVFIKKST